MSVKPDEGKDFEMRLSYADRLGHLSSGYSNSQSVVRLLDTKASAVIGAVPVILTLYAGLFAWCYSGSKFAELAACSFGGALIIALCLVTVTLMCLGGAAIVSAFSALEARCPSEPSVLFPYAADGFDERVVHYLNDAKEKDVLDDYVSQVCRMAEIVTLKITYVNTAIRRLKWFMVAVAIAALLLVTVVIYYDATFRFEAKENSKSNSGQIETG